MSARFHNILLIATVGLILCVAWSPFLLEYSLEVFLAVVVVLGIPHGSLDHFVVLRKEVSDRRKLVNFIFYYVLIMILSGIFWWFLPNFTLLLFLLASVFHFGQSQLGYISVSNALKVLLYGLWGYVALGLIIVYNLRECRQIFASLPILDTAVLFDRFITFELVMVAVIALVLTLTILTLTNRMTFAQWIMELSLLSSIFVLSYLTNAVFSFAVYFGLWHSLKSLKLEYELLRRSINTFSLRNFLWSIIPLSTAGILFMILLYKFIPSLTPGISPYMVFIILISILTFPHLIFMSDLYEKHKWRIGFR